MPSQKRTRAQQPAHLTAPARLSDTTTLAILRLDNPPHISPFVHYGFPHVPVCGLFRFAAPSRSSSRNTALSSASGRQGQVLQDTIFQQWHPLCSSAAKVLEHPVHGVGPSCPLLPCPGQSRLGRRRPVLTCRHPIPDDFT